MHAPQYHETLFSRIYPGKQESSPAYVPTLNALDTFLALTSAQKQGTILRSDAGFGCDANINHTLNAEWQVLTKNKGGRRPQAFARQIADQDWRPFGFERWVARAVAPPTYARPNECLMLRWLTSNGQVKPAIVICSVTDWTMEEIIAHYDDRGACETEIQADKSAAKPASSSCRGSGRGLGAVVEPLRQPLTLAALALPQLVRCTGDLLPPEFCAKSGCQVWSRKAQVLIASVQKPLVPTAPADADPPPADAPP